MFRGLNAGADMLSRGTPLYKEGTLYQAAVEQIWAQSVDVCASRENVRCVRFRPLQSVDAPLCGLSSVPGAPATVGLAPEQLAEYFNGGGSCCW